MDILIANPLPPPPPLKAKDMLDVLFRELKASSVAWDVLYGVLGINCYKLQFFVKKTLDPDPVGIQPKMLDPDPESMNPDRNQ